MSDLRRPALILKRIDAAIALMKAEGMAIRAIYLARTDLEDFLAAQAVIQRPVRHRSYDVRPIIGKGSSKIYSNRGVARAVPRAV
ncbi:hypothetical protein [Sphingomonas bacterium]|uniref:hypothetical protein n=1 Tax=Sphingomonas bacterium TaxID=1895847 RepID=UPI0015757FA0|nr:hypothetical protein [Sphingomonas bacterium]